MEKVTSSLNYDRNGKLLWQKTCGEKHKNEIKQLVAKIMETIASVFNKLLPWKLGAAWSQTFIIWLSQDHELSTSLSRD